jgi:hypothetical protein
MAAVAVVMQQDEVADAFKFQRGGAVVFPRQNRIAGTVGKEIDQLFKSRLDQRDGRRFQRFEKARRKADADAVADQKARLCPAPKRMRLGSASASPSILA